MNVVTTIIIIGSGATIGASLRYYLGLFIQNITNEYLPYATLAVNVIGSFLAGILVIVLLEKTSLNETYKLFLLVGFAGSLTTMSALSLESLQMISYGQYTQAVINILLNIALSLFFMFIGITLAKYTKSLFM
jgi:CrcB protein